MALLLFDLCNPLLSFPNRIFKAGHPAKFVLIAIFALSTFLENCFAADVLSLEEAISLALIHNPTLQAHYLDRLVSANEINLQKSEFLPKLNFEMTGSRQEEGVDSKERTTLYKAYPSIQMKTPLGTELKVYAETSHHTENVNRHHDQSVTLLVKQPLSKGVRKKVTKWQIENAEVNYALEMLQIQRSVETVIQDIILAFMNYQQSTWQVDLQKQYIQQAERFYEQINEKYKAGRVAANDRIAPQLQIKQAKQSLLIAQNDKKRHRTQLYEFIGITDDGQRIDVSFQSVDETPMLTLQQILEKDIGITVLKMEADRLKSDLLITKDQQRFDLNFQADMHFGRSHHHYLENLTDFGYYHALPKHQKGYAASLNLLIPLGDRQRHYQQLLVKNTAIQKNILEMRQRERILAAQFDDMTQEIVLKKEQQQLIAEELKLAELEYDSVLEQYWIGRLSINEVMRAKERQHSVSLNLSRAKLDLTASYIKFQKLSGILLENWHVSIH